MNLDVKGILTACVDYVKNNPLIFAPQVLLGILSFVLLLVLIGGTVGLGLGVGGDAGIGAAIGALFLFFVIMLVAAFVTLGWTAGMAAEVVEDGTTSLGSGFSKFTASLGPFVVAYFIAGIIIGIGTLLCVIPGIVAAFFLMFALPAVIVGRMGGVESLQESFALVKENLVDCLVLAAVALGLSIVSYIISTIISVVLGIIPVIGVVGGLIGGIIQAAVGTFILVMVFEYYKELTGGPAMAAEAPQPMA